MILYHRETPRAWSSSCSKNVTQGLSVSAAWIISSAVFLFLQPLRSSILIFFSPAPSPLPSQRQFPGPSGGADGKEALPHTVKHEPEPNFLVELSWWEYGF
jgi:hypothetical protein